MTPLAPTLDPLLLFVLFLNYLRLKVVNFNPDEAVLILSDSSEQEKQSHFFNFQVDEAALKKRHAQGYDLSFVYACSFGLWSFLNHSGVNFYYMSLFFTDG